jgi:hypothetical protein
MQCNGRTIDAHFGIPSRTCDAKSVSRDCQVIALDHLPDDIVDLTLCQRFASGIWKQRWGIIIDAQLLPKGSESLEVTPALD